MMGIIGFSVGIVGFLLHQIIDIISEFKWELTSYYIQAIINTYRSSLLFSSDPIYRKEIFPVPLPSLSATRSSLWWPAARSSSTSPPPPAPGSQKSSAFLTGQKSKTFSNFKHSLSSSFRALLQWGRVCPWAMRSVIMVVKRFSNNMMTISGSYDSFGQFSCRWYLAVQIRNLFILSTLLSFNLLNLAITRVKLLNSSVCSDSNCSF